MVCYILCRDFLNQPDPAFKLHIHSGEVLPLCQAAKQGAHIPQNYFMCAILLDSSHVLISTVPGIYGSKQTESKGIAQGQCLL